MGVAFLLSCLTSYFAIPIIIRAAKKNHFFDQPDHNRKLHIEAIPTLGGVAIFFAFLLSFAINPWANVIEGFPYIVAALLILFFIGLKDDLVILSAKKKLIAQISAAALVIFGSGILISDFQGVLGLADIPHWAAVIVTFVTIIGVINAVNLIDGIDGLAGGVGLISSFLFGGAFFYAGQLSMAVFSLCLAGALLGFLYYNFSPASIFMGDTGSMILGFLLSIQAIQFIGLGSYPEFYSLFGNAAPILAVSILALPLFDTLRVVFKRLRRKSSIFEPGKDHIHHELLRMGLSHKNASLLLYAESIALVSLMATLSLFDIGVNLLLGILLFSSTVMLPTNGFKRRILASLFGYDWQAYRRKKWGIEFNHNEMTPINNNVESEAAPQNTFSDTKEQKEEADSMVI